MFQGGDGLRGESSNAPSINDAPQGLLDFTRRLRKASDGLGKNDPMIRLLLAAALALP